MKNAKTFYNLEEECAFFLLFLHNPQYFSQNIFIHLNLVLDKVLQPIDCDGWEMSSFSWAFLFSHFSGTVNISLDTRVDLNDFQFS